MIDLLPFEIKTRKKKIFSFSQKKFAAVWRQWIKFQEYLREQGTKVLLI